MELLEKTMNFLAMLQPPVWEKSEFRHVAKLQISPYAIANKALRSIQCLETILESALLVQKIHEDPGMT